MRIGYIYFNNIFCGILEENDEYIFTYDENYNGNPISLLLPITKRKYNSKTLFPFFDGLIAEGYLLEKGSKMYNISLLDRMGLLLELCNDCVGAVSVFKVKK